MAEAAPHDGDDAILPIIGGAERDVAAFADDRHPPARRDEKPRHAEAGARAQKRKRTVLDGLAATDPPHLVGPHAAERMSAA
jgi:hypothetical protein